MLKQVDERAEFTDEKTSAANHMTFKQLKGYACC